MAAQKIVVLYYFYFVSKVMTFQSKLGITVLVMFIKDIMEVVSLDDFGKNMLSNKDILVKDILLCIVFHVKHVSYETLKDQ